MYLMKYKPVFIRLFEDQAEQLRRLAFIRKESQSKIIRDLFDDFYNKPRSGEAINIQAGGKAIVTGTFPKDEVNKPRKEVIK